MLLSSPTPLRNVEKDVRVVAAGIDHPECVAWHNGRIYCGTESGALLEIDPRNGTTREIGRSGGFILGLTFTPQGRIVICDWGRHEVLQMDLSGQVSALAREVGGRQLSTPNYPIVLPDGALLVSDSGSGWGSDDGFLFTIDPVSLETRIVATDCPRFTNGLALAPDQRSVYVVESRLPGVVRYELNGRELKSRTVVVELPRTVPDGLACDTAGNLYISCCRPDRIYRLTAGGKLDIYLDDYTAEFMCSPTNICFGGDDHQTLFMAALSGWTVTAIDAGVRGLPQGATLTQRRLDV